MSMVKNSAEIPPLGDGNIVGRAVAVYSPGAVFGGVGDAVFEFSDARHLAVDITEDLVGGGAPDLPVFQLGEHGTVRL
mgnify:CR=1 FL=1